MCQLADEKGKVDSTLVKAMVEKRKSVLVYTSPVGISH